MGTRLYVGNLPYSTDETALKSLFGDGQDGRRVTEVKIVLDRETGRPRGFAFVELSNAEHARVAMEKLNKSSVGGRTIVVNEAKEMQRGGGGSARMARPAGGGAGAAMRPAG